MLADQAPLIEENGRLENAYQQACQTLETMKVTLSHAQEQRKTLAPVKKQLVAERARADALQAKIQQAETERQLLDQELLHYKKRLEGVEKSFAEEKQNHAALRAILANLTKQRGNAAQPIG